MSKRTIPAMRFSLSDCIRKNWRTPGWYFGQITLMGQKKGLLYGEICSQILERFSTKNSWKEAEFPVQMVNFWSFSKGQFFLERPIFWPVAEKSRKEMATLVDDNLAEKGPNFLYVQMVKFLRFFPSVNFMSSGRIFEGRQKNLEKSWKPLPRGPPSG